MATDVGSRVVKSVWLSGRMFYVPIQSEEGAVDHWTLSNSVHIVRRAIHFTFSFASFSQLNISLLILHRIVKLEVHLSTLVKTAHKPYSFLWKIRSLLTLGNVSFISDRLLVWFVMWSTKAEVVNKEHKGQRRHINIWLSTWAVSHSCGVLKC